MLSKLEFQPGIVTDDTALASESTYADADNIRFVRDRPQTIGGWEAAGGGTFENPARGAHAWAALTGDRVVAFGTASKLYSFFGGAIKDITPEKATGTLVNPFSVTSGSDVVLVTDLDHGLTVGDVVSFRLVDAVGGLTLNGSYTVISVPTIDTYTIKAPSAATSTATGGGTLEFTAPLAMGLIDGVGGTGWGTGTYGTGLYGQATGGDINPRVWSLDNWGSNLLAVPRNGALYEWQPLPTYNQLIPNSDFASSTGWNLGTGWTISGGKANAAAGTESAMSRNVAGVLSGGVVYEVTFDIVRTAGAVRFQVQSEDTATGTVTIGEPIAKSGTYVRKFKAPSRPILAGIAKDATFAGSVDNFQIRVVPVAYRINGAPQYSTGMFVDPNRIVVCYGTIELDGDFNPLQVRWSAQEDNTKWIPDDDNLAGDYLLASGSRIIGALATRGQNLIWTDSALYTMRFTGSSDDVFNFALAGTGCGLIGKNAAVEHQGRVYWWGRNGQFYAYSGGEPQIIPCGIRREAWDNFSPSQEEKVFAAVNAEFNEIWWFYPDRRDGNECSRYVSFNWETGIWSKGTMARTSWITAGVYANPLGFSTDGRIYFHERGRTANGGPIMWRLLSGMVDIEDGENLFTIKRYVHDFEDQAGNVLVKFTFSQWPRGPTVSTKQYEITPARTDVPMRQLGRQCQIEWTAGTNSQFVRWGTQRLDIDKTGARR